MNKILKSLERIAKASEGGSMNGSTVAPAEDGNTKSSSSARGNGAKHWLVTLKCISGPTTFIGSDGSNGSNGSDGSVVPVTTLTTWIEKHTDYASYQLEQGDETGYVHWQISLKLKDKQRFSWLSRHFSPIAHVEEIRNIDAADKYSHKVETRILGPYFHPKPVETVTDYFTKRGHTYKWWQQEILDIMKTEPEGRNVYWYWEPSGKVGKSVFMRHIILRHNVFPLSNAKTADVAYAYKKMTPDQNTIIINLPRSSEGHLNYNAIESMLDGMIFSTKYESGFVMRNFTHMIFFANFHPDTTGLSEDRWVIKDISE